MTTSTVALPFKNLFQARTAPTSSVALLQRLPDGESRWEAGKANLTHRCRLDALPELPDGAERSFTGACKQHATGLQIQGCASPRRRSAFALAGCLRGIPF